MSYWYEVYSCLKRIFISGSVFTVFVTKSPISAIWIYNWCFFDTIGFTGTTITSLPFLCIGVTCCTQTNWIFTPKTWVKAWRHYFLCLWIKQVNLGKKKKQISPTSKNFPELVSKTKARWSTTGGKNCVGRCAEYNCGRLWFLKVFKAWRKGQ